MNADDILAVWDDLHWHHHSGGFLRASLGFAHTVEVRDHTLQCGSLYQGAIHDHSADTLAGVLAGELMLRVFEVIELATPSEFRLWSTDGPLHHVDFDCESAATRYIREHESLGLRARQLHSVMPYGQAAVTVTKWTHHTGTAPRCLVETSEGPATPRVPRAVRDAALSRAREALL